MAESNAGEAKAHAANVVWCVLQVGFLCMREHPHLAPTLVTCRMFCATPGMLGSGRGEKAHERAWRGSDGSGGGGDSRRFHCMCPVLDLVSHGIFMSTHRDPFLSNNKYKARHKMVS